MGRASEMIRAVNTANETPSKLTELEDSYPLSPLQQGMFFHTLLEPGSGVDIDQALVELHEALNVTAFQRAWRSGGSTPSRFNEQIFVGKVGSFRQEVHAQIELPWEERDWTGIEDAEREKRFANPPVLIAVSWIRLDACSAVAPDHVVLCDDMKSSLPPKINLSDIFPSYRPFRTILCSLSLKAKQRSSPNRTSYLVALTQHHHKIS